MAKKQQKTTIIVAAIIAGVVALAVALFFILKGGANSGEQVVTYKGSTVKGIETTLTYYAKDDKVYKQTSKSVIPYSALGVTSAEEAKELFDDIIESLQDIDGYTDEVEYTDNEVIETVSVDFDVADLNKLEELNIWLMKDGDLTSGISLSESAKYLEENGFTKVEK